MRFLSVLAAFLVIPVFGRAACPEFNPIARVGSVANSSLTEISGLGASRINPGVLWTHNDSGDQNRIFALKATGAHIATFYFGGATATDWEDMAIGPGPIAGRDYLYVADTGNNSLSRSTATIYRVGEPSLAGIAAGSQWTLTGVDALHIRYPDGPQDVETILVDPRSADILLITRDRNLTGQSRVYAYRAVDQKPGVVVAVTYVTSISSTVEIKGGDVSPDGSWLLLRRHSSSLTAEGWLFSRADGTSLESALANTPCLAPLPAEPQGEAVAFAADGSGYFTISEGISQPIYFVGELTPPATPGNFAGSSTSTTTVNLSWTDMAATESGFILERSTDGITFSPGISLPPNSTTYKDAGLSPGQLYKYRLAAYNNAGFSASVTTTVTTLSVIPLPPAAPSGLSATAVSKSQVNLAWTDNSTDETGFKIERSTDGTRFTQIVTVGAGTVGYADRTVTGNKRYYYRMRAYNTAGDSPYSNTPSVVTPKK